MHFKLEVIYLSEASTAHHWNLSLWQSIIKGFHLLQLSSKSLKEQDDLSDSHPGLGTSSFPYIIRKPTKCFRSAKLRQLSYSAMRRSPRGSFPCIPFLGGLEGQSFSTLSYHTLRNWCCSLSTLRELCGKGWVLQDCHLEWLKGALFR